MSCSTHEDQVEDSGTERGAVEGTGWGSGGKEGEG